MMKSWNIFILIFNLSIKIKETGPFDVEEVVYFDVEEVVYFDVEEVVYFTNFFIIKNPFTTKVFKAFYQ